jgi:hypothetical protein
MDSFSFDCSMEGNEYTNKCSTVHRKVLLTPQNVLFQKCGWTGHVSLYLSNSFFT